MMTKNPFKYGEPVTCENFADREAERKEIAHDLYSGQNVILYSPRRTGKTSLIMEVERILRDTYKVDTCYIDLFGILSQEEMASRIVNRLLLNLYPMRSALEKAANTLLKLVPTEIAIARGETRVDLIFGKKPSPPQIEEVLDLSQKAAADKKKHLVVFFDEFQEINSLDGAKIEKVMRTRLQHHKNVSYLFAGSKVSVLREMFDDERRAFYKFGKTTTLTQIPANEFSEFIKTKFFKTGKSIDDIHCMTILEFSEGNPYVTQQACHEVWYLTEKAVEKETIQKALASIIIKQKDSFEKLWESMRSRSQKALLIGMADAPIVNIYSKDFIGKYDLVSAAHVQKAMRQLEKRRIIEDGKIADVFFQEWIKRGRR